MTSTINITRKTRVENETGISGLETESVNSADILEQLITAATEEQTAMGAFKAAQLQSLSMSCDVDATVQLLGTRFAVLQTVAGPPGTITHTGDLEQEIFAGDLVRLEGMPAAGDDQVYKVATVVEGAGTTTITLDNGQVIPTAGGGAVGTVARVCSHQQFPYAYTLVTQTAAGGALTYTGDLTDKFAAGDWITIAGSTGNDGIWLITSVTHLAGTTTIVVEDTTGANTLPDGTNTPGIFYKTRPAIELVANIPMQWSIEGGTNNPFAQEPSIVATFLGTPPLFNAFRGNVAFAMVSVPGATNGNFKGRIGLDPII